jgi:hypothetical protein
VTTGQESAVAGITALAQRGVIRRMKVETESEGAHWDAISLLRTISTAANLPLVLKIGGCEAITDIVRAKWLGISEITAPMIETAFAADKFRQAFATVHGGISAPQASVLIESETGVANVDAIIEHSRSWVRGINVGRSDLSASMNLHSTTSLTQDSLEVLDLVRRVVSRAHEAGLETTVGGRMTEESIVAMGERLGDAHPHCVETRRFVVDWNAVIGNPETMNEVLRIERTLALEVSAAFNWEASRWAQYVATLDNRLAPPAPRESVL